MPTDEIPDALLDKLIEFGKSDDFSHVTSLITVQEQHRYVYIMRLAPQPWYRVAESLSTEDLVALIKCLTIAERRLEGWVAGSVSPVIWLFRSLSGLDPNLAYSVADWVLTHRENDYLPFGTLMLGVKSMKSLGVKSLAEYYRLEEAKLERAKARREAEAHQQELARERKAQQATYALIGAVKRADVKAVKALIAKGADTNAKDSAGVSIGEHARMKGNQEILELLQAASAGE